MYMAKRNEGLTLRSSSRWDCVNSDTTFNQIHPISTTKLWMWSHVHITRFKQKKRQLKILPPRSCSAIRNIQQWKVANVKRYQKQYNDFSFQWFFNCSTIRFWITCWWENLPCKINLKFIFSAGWSWGAAVDDVYEPKFETSHAGTCVYDEWKMKTKHYSLLFYLCFII